MIETAFATLIYVTAGFVACVGVAVLFAIAKAKSK